MNTSYGVGEVFATQIEEGDTLADASAKEVKQIQEIYKNPVKAQAELMDGAGHTSFDVRKYMDKYREHITPAVKAAIDDGVHYGNIVTIPAYCVGDIAHHIAQSTFNMCKDDVIMATIDAVTGVMEKTLDAGVDTMKSEFDILSVATGASACATEYILELDGFNAPMIVDLLTKRFHNLVQLNPTRVLLLNCITATSWICSTGDGRSLTGHGEELPDQARSSSRKWLAVRSISLRYTRTRC